MTPILAKWPNAIEVGNLAPRICPAAVNLGGEPALDPIPFDALGTFGAFDALTFDALTFDALTTLGSLKTLALDALGTFSTFNSLALDPLRALGALKTLALDALRTFSTFDALALDPLRALGALKTLALDAPGVFSTFNLLALDPLRALGPLLTLSALRALSLLFRAAPAGLGPAVAVLASALAGGRRRQCDCRNAGDQEKFASHADPPRVINIFGISTN